MKKPLSVFHHNNSDNTERGFCFKNTMICINHLIMSYIQYLYYIIILHITFLKLFLQIDTQLLYTTQE